jgi:hypothetical protein
MAAWEIGLVLLLTGVLLGFLTERFAPESRWLGWVAVVTGGGGGLLLLFAPGGQF